MADILAGIAPQKDTYANWVTLNPTLGKIDSGDDYSQMIFATGSPVGDILIWGMAQSFTVAYAAGQYVIQGKEREILSKSADYTITDSDPDIIEITTGVTDRTITLPTLADNTGRKIKIIKVDSGIGKVIIDGEGAETIDGNTDIELYQQYDNSTIICGVAFWNIESYNLSPYDTEWVANSDWTDADLSITHGLGVNLPNLNVRVFLSPTGADTDSIEVDTVNISIFGSASSATEYHGITKYNVDTNTIKLQTGEFGVGYHRDSDGRLVVLGAASAWYYKVVITKSHP